MDRPESNFELLCRASASNSPSTAISLCNQIIEADPDHLPAIELKVKSQWRLGLYEQALEGLAMAIRLNPHDPAYQFLRGDCYQNLLRYGDALDAYERCSATADSELAAQAQLRLRGLFEWQAALMEDLFRSRPELAAQFRNAALTCESYGFRPNSAAPTESVLARLASPAMWARPS